MGSINQKRYISYLPYIKEGFFSFAIDLLICFVGTLLFFGMGIVNINGWLFMVFPLYLLVECFINYRIMLLSVLEVNMGLYEKERLQFVTKKRAPELVGKWEPILPKLLPQYSYIEKSILIFKRTDGTIIKLRCVFYGTSYRKPPRYNSSKEDSMLINAEEVEYGRFSKFIISRRDGKTSDDNGLWNRRYFQ